MRLQRPTRRHITVGGIVGGVGLVLGGLGVVADRVIDLNKKVGDGGTVTDSLFYNDSLIFTRLSRLEKAAGIKGRRVRPAKPQTQGLVRRVFHLLF